MKFLGETNCAVFGDLSPFEFNSYVTKFGRKHLSNPKTIVCHLPTLTQTDFKAHERFFNRPLAKAQFVIATLAEKNKPVYHGDEGQDRDNYSDEQDRKSYTVSN